MSGRHRTAHGGELILWHPAFCEAISMDLEPWKDVLEFKFEYELTTGPLKIDVLIIRKLTADPIKGNIATLFREYNILEYKSPEDYISVDNFYKVYGYACFYASLHSKNIDSLTISLVGSRYPKELLRHLEKTRGYRVEEAYSGIYHVTGDILPIQIIETARLSAGEHLWLKSLSDDLDISQTDSILRESGKKGKDAPVRAYLNALLLANQQAVEEVLRMRNGTLTLEKVLENAGLTKKWIAEGETRGKAEGRTEGQEEKALEIARNLIRRGWAPGDIAEITNLDPMKIQPLYDRPPRGKSGRNR